MSKILYSDVSAEVSAEDRVIREMQQHWQIKDQLCSALWNSRESDLISRAEKMYGCGRQVTYALNNSGEVRLHDATFCRQRICPVCQWRRSLKVWAIMQAALESLGEEYRYILITCSRPNCSADELGREISVLTKASDMMFKEERIKKAAKGFYRALEVTIAPNTHLFHPHLHIMVAVRKSYFTSRTYVRQDEWCEIWDRCNGWDSEKMGYNLNLDVRRLTSERGVNAGLAEVCKYCVKPMSMYNPERSRGENEQLMVELAAACNRQMSGRRLMRTQGVVADAVRATTKQKSADEALNGDDYEIDSQHEEIVQLLHYEINDGYYEYVASSTPIDNELCMG